MKNIFLKKSILLLIFLTLISWECSQNSYDSNDNVKQNKKEHKTQNTDQDLSQTTSINTINKSTSFYFEENFENCEVGKPVPDWTIVDNMDWLVQIPSFDPSHKWYKGYGSGYFTTAGDSSWEDYVVDCYIYTINTKGVVDILCDVSSFDDRFYMLELGNQSLSLVSYYYGTYKLLAKVPCKYSTNQNYHLQIKTYHKPDDYYRHWLVGTCYRPGAPAVEISIEASLIEKGKIGLRTYGNQAWVDRITVSSLTFK